MKLTKEDYIKILNFYNITYRKNNFNHIKRKAENILADKLCRCIKRVKTPSDKDENRARRWEGQKHPGKLFPLRPEK